MKNIITLLIFFSIISYFSCQEENLNDIAENQFVVEAFLYAGEPIDDIKIKTTYALSASEDISVPINNAEVTLIKNGERFNLTSTNNDGFYSYTGTDVMVETNDVFQLEVAYNGILATAETIVPTPTTGLDLSKDTLFVPMFPATTDMDSIVNTIRNFLSNSTIEATWDNPEEDLYFLVVESVNDTLDPIFPAQVIEALTRFRFVSEPTDAASFSFLAGALESFGTYSVKVYHINQEYADLYENREQDSRDLNEPPSNIRNALGVFSAFNSQEAFFEVAQN